MQNLEEAILKARKEANGHESFDSIRLTISSNNEFRIGERCSRNVSFSNSEVLPGQPHLIHMTIPRDCTFNQVVTWDLLVFCTKFGIKVSDHKFTYITGEEI